MDIYYYHDTIMIPMPFTARGFSIFNEEVSDNGKNQNDRRRKGKNMIRLDNGKCIIGFDGRERKSRDHGGRGMR